MRKVISVLLAVAMLAGFAVPTLASESAAEDRFVYAGLDFENESGLVTTFQAADGNTTGMSIGIGDGKMNFSVPKGIKSSSYSDLRLPQLAGEQKYVVRTKFKINSIEGSSKMTLFDAKPTKEDGTGWRMGVYIVYNEGGLFGIGSGVRLYDDKGKYEKIKKGQEYTFAAVYDLDAGTAKYYLDGSKVLSDITGLSGNPYIFRVDADARGGDGALNFYIDELTVYTGSDYNAAFVSKSGTTIMDDAAATLRYIGSAHVFSAVGGGYVSGGEKHAYPSGCAPVIYDEQAYVPQGFTAGILGISADFSDAIDIDGTRYIKAERAAQLAGKSYTYDERGSFVLSDGAFKYTDGDKFENAFEPADMIYRYVTFDNPSGASVIAQLKSRMDGVHPRILYTADEIQYLKEQAESDSEVATAMRYAVELAERKMSGTIVTANCTAANRQSEATSMQEAVYRLAEAYLMTEDTKYADRAAELLDAAAQWSELSYSVSNLTTGHWAMAFAMGYDSFYNYLNETEAGRAKLASWRNAAARLAFADTIGAYRGEKNIKWVNIVDNFAGVIAGGVTALALSMADEEQFADTMPYLLENLIKSCEIAAGLFDRNGGYFEGISYSEYLLANFQTAIEALYKCCATDYGMLNSRGLLNAGDFFAYIQTPNGAFNFSDAPASGELLSILPYWLAYRGNARTAAGLYRTMQSNTDKRIYLRSMFFTKKAGISAESRNVSTDRYYPDIATGTFRNEFDTARPTFAAFHADRNGVTHDHLDMGQFMFESDGVRWAYDIGSDNYNISDYFGKTGYRLYRKNAEGHNVAVINPTSYSDGYYGQSPEARASLTAYESKPRGAFAAFDITEAYSRDASSYVRGFYFGDDRNTLTIQDEISLLKSSELYWFMHTDADISLSSDKKSAVLTKNGKSLKAELYCSNSAAEFSILDNTPITASTEGAQNPGSRLTVHLTGAAGVLTIAVKLTPQNGKFEPSAMTVVPIEQWSVADGEIPTAALAVESPADGALLCESDIPLRIHSADGVPNVSVDGVQLQTEACGDGIYTARAAYSEFNLGRHKIEVSCGENSVVRYVETTALIGEKHSLTYDNIAILGGTSERCDGSDGEVNGGVRIVRGQEGDAFIKNISPNMSGKTAVVTFDYKKPRFGGSFNLEAKNGNSFIWLGARTLIADNGQLDGGDIYLKPERWYNLRVEQELQNRGEYRIYLDGELVRKANSSYDFSKLSVLKLQVLSGSVCLDNIIWGEYETNPRCTAVSYTIDGVQYDVTDGAVPVSADALILHMDKAFDSVSADKIRIGGLAASEVSASGNAITIVPEYLPLINELKIELDGSLTIGGDAVGKSYGIQIRTYGANDSREDFIDEINLERVGDEADASVLLAGGNGKKLAGGARLIIAAYDNNTLAAIDSDAWDFTQEFGKIDVRLSGLDESESVAAFLWDKNCAPLAAAQRK